MRLVSGASTVRHPGHREREQHVGPNERDPDAPGYQVLVEAGPVAMILVDETGRIAMVNSEVERMFGYSRSELLGQSIDVLVPEAWRARDASLREGVATRPDPRPIAGRRTLSGRRKHRGEIAIDVELVALSTGEEQFVLAAITDVARRAHEQPSDDEILAVVSHELRSPIEAIVAWSRLLRAGTFTGPETVRALETIERNARSQVRLIDELLDRARITHGRIELRLETCDPATVVGCALDSLAPIAAAKGVHLHTALRPVPPITADPGRLEQIVLNLVSNAVKFTPPGGNIDVQLTDARSHVELTVRDDGRGIQREFLARAFDPFSQQSASSDRRGGLGLGLAIVRQLVALHGGTITVASEGEGKGATFVVRLPTHATAPTARS